MPWLGLALLPLPLATTLSRQTDLVVVLALLEWPRILAIAQDVGAPHPAAQAAGARRMAAALNSLPPLILATLALAQATGALDITALARAPGEFASISAQALHWLGAVGWTLALPPALGIGPFAAGAPANAPPRHGEHRETELLSSAPLRALCGSVVRLLHSGAIELGLDLRAIGLIWMAALPWMAALGALDEGSSGASFIIGWLLPPLTIAALLSGFDRLTARQTARRWARAYLVLDSLLLLALLWAAYAALQSRLA